VVWVLLVFMNLVCVWVYFHFCCARGLCQGLQGVKVCRIVVVGYSAGGESVGGRGSVGTGWERIRGEGEDGINSG
jgi:hypothetical protein